MQYRQLGRSGIEVSVICQGCWSIVTDDETWGGNDPGESVAAIRAALDAGITFFDTAEGYGRGESEEILARALEGRRSEAVIASKVSGEHLAPADVRAACERSLRRLKSDTIDLYQVHWPGRGDVPLDETLGAMEALRDEGKIRAIGVSNFGTSVLAEARCTRRVVSNQLAYSLLWRAVEHAVQPACVRAGLAVLCYSPIAQGLLTGKFASANDVPHGRARTRLFSRDRPESRHGEAGCEAETFAALARIRRTADRIGQPMGHVALAWLLRRPGVMAVIAGGRSAHQARDNAAAADLALDDETVADLTAATEAVKAHVGTNADMWQSNSRMER